MKRIRIFQQHTQAGKTYPAGSEIELPDADADFVLAAEGARRAELIKKQARVEAFVAEIRKDAGAITTVNVAAGGVRYTSAPTVVKKDTT